MSDIYCNEDVIDFTNPFLDFDQGYQALRKITTIPVSPKTVLPETLLTRRGYPRGESQGDSSGVVILKDLISSKGKRGRHHYPTEEERAARDERLYIYRYNQAGEKTRRDNGSCPYPTLTGMRTQIETSKYRHDSFREIGLGDAVMMGKMQWRKHLSSLNLDGFPKAWLQRGLREIHHGHDKMDGRMDACLGYTAVLGAEIYDSIKELSSDMREEQKKRALDGWDCMNVKRQLEDSLREAQGEISDLKARVDTLEFLVEKLTQPVPEVPQEAVFRPASPPLPDIGFPPDMEIPGLTINQTVVDEFIDWSSFDRTWPHGGYEADVEVDVDGDSNKENEWVTVPVDE